jgi:GT2 family glycosyltransferase
LSRTSPKLAIVIVTYSSGNVIFDCLESIYSKNDLDDAIEVIIVDNSPTDGRENKDIKRRFPKTRLIYNNRNAGFGQANNLGARNTSAEFLLFLNPDTIIIEPIFQWAVHQFEKNPKEMLFGIKLINHNKRFAYSFKIYPHYYISSFPLRPVNRILNYLNIAPTAHFYTEGADIFIRRSVFIKVGGFDESFFMYFEEPLLSLKIKNLGFQNHFYKEKKMVHLEGMGSINEFKSKNYMASLMKYLEFVSIDKEKFLKRKGMLMFCQSIFFFWHPKRTHYWNQAKLFIEYSSPNRQKD